MEDPPIFLIYNSLEMSEAEILTIIVKGRKSNAIFDELYSFLKLSR